MDQGQRVYYSLRFFIYTELKTVLLERQSRAYVEARIRAGVLEQGTVNMLREVGVNERMDRDGLVHDGFALAFDGRNVRIDMHKLTGGSTVMIYGQTQVTEDLIRARIEAGGDLKYEAPAITVEDYLDGETAHYLRASKVSERS